MTIANRFALPGRKAHERLMREIRDEVAEQRERVRGVDRRAYLAMQENDRLLRAVRATEIVVTRRAK